MNINDDQDCVGCGNVHCECATPNQKPMPPRVFPPKFWVAYKPKSERVVELVLGGDDHHPPLLLPPCSSDDLPYWFRSISLDEHEQRVNEAIESWKNTHRLDTAEKEVLHKRIAELEEALKKADELYANDAERTRVIRAALKGKP